MSYNSQPSYIDHLLILRGLSSLGVILIHCLNCSDYSLGHYLKHDMYNHPIVQKLLLFWPSTGTNFVMFFFVLSGYLMGKVYFQNRYSLNRKDIFRFYKGRFLRIAPLLYFNLFLLVCLNTYSHPYPIPLLGDIFFLNNFTGRIVNYVTWSISYEMQYYFIAPMVFKLFREVSLKSLVLILLSASVVSILYYFRDVPFIGTLGKFLFVFICGFGINIILRLNPRLTKFNYSNSLAIYLGFFGGNTVFYYFKNLGYDYIAVLFITAIAALTIFILELPEKVSAVDQYQEGTKNLKLLFLRLFTWLGIISYGLYLWHLPILLIQQKRMVYAVDKLIGSGLIGKTPPLGNVIAYHLIQFPLILFLAIALSYVTFFIIELRYRPNLYNINESRFVTKYLKI